MSKTVRNGLIGFAVTMAISFILTMKGARGFQVYVASVSLGLVVGGVLQSLSGTGKEVFASDAEREAALQAVPGAGQARVFVRRSGYLGFKLGINVLMDGVQFAQLRCPRFTAVMVPAGRHVLNAINSGSGPFNQRQMGTAEFAVQPGETVLFDLGMELGGLLTLVRHPNALAVLPELRRVKMIRAQATVAMQEDKANAGVVQRGA